MTRSAVSIAAPVRAALPFCLLFAPAALAAGADPSIDAPAGRETDAPARRGGRDLPVPADDSDKPIGAGAPEPTDPAAAARAEAAKFAKFDKLMPQGQTTEFPGNYETILRDTGGFRSWLYARDIFFNANSISSMTNDLVGRPDGVGMPQSYTGEKFTANSNLSARIGWKFAGRGNDVTQVNVGVNATIGTWRNIAPPPGKFGFTRLDISSTFLDQAVQVTAGYGGNLLNYIGIFSGGNPILANGVAGSIPSSNGLGSGNVPTPLINVRINAKNGFYSKSGIQRSVSPRGIIEEMRTNGVGLGFSRDGARALFIQEFGIQREAAEGQPKMWLRAGGAYNLTQYSRFDLPGATRRNWMAYALADYQVLRTDPMVPQRGLSVGASVLFADGRVNAFSRTLEARAYGTGLVPGRPSDQVSLTISHNQFGEGLRIANALGGRPVHKGQFSIGGLYVARIQNGLYIGNSLTYIRNPSATDDFSPAVNLSTTLTFLL